MQLPNLKHPLFLLLALLVASTLAFAACSDDDDDEDGDGGDATATEDSGDAAEVDISGVEELEDGTLTIGSDIAYAPIEFFEEGTDNPVGLDIDIANAMGEKLGVEVEFEQVADFAGIVGDLTSGRYDVVMSAISITPEREAEIDFIPYFGPVGTGILTLKDNPQAFAGVEDLCGHPVAAQDGTFQIEQMETLNADTCADNPLTSAPSPTTRLPCRTLYSAASTHSSPTTLWLHTAPSRTRKISSSSQCRASRRLPMASASARTQRRSTMR